MDARIFRPAVMGYAQDLEKKERLNLPERLRKI
jgi:hypothetical protein